VAANASLKAATNEVTGFFNKLDVLKQRSLGLTMRQIPLLQLVADSGNLMQFNPHSRSGHTSARLHEMKISILFICLNRDHVNRFWMGSRRGGEQHTGFLSAVFP
jgi:hypothetical protein